MPQAEGSGGRAELVLYSRRYCHLCDEMLAALRSLPLERPVSVEVVDVDADPELEERFGELVPLLMHGETEVSRYRLDLERVRALLSEAR
jgi:thioredoxin reductase (NADPH)